MRIQPQKKKLNKFESKQARETQLKQIYHGEGLYVYRNRTNGDLTLPKPTTHGIKVVRPNQEWEGDNYYMSLVPQEAVLVRVLITPTQERENLKMEEQKLILDQPDMVTSDGQVEHVVTKKPQVLSEAPVDSQTDILINEDPMDGVQILRD